MQNKSYTEIFHADIRRDDISSLRHETFRSPSRERSHLESEFLFTIGPQTFPNVALKLNRMGRMAARLAVNARDYGPLCPLDRHYGRLYDTNLVATTFREERSF